MKAATPAEIEPLRLAKAELKRGIAPLPIPRGKKRCEITGWPSLVITEETVAQYFNGASLNIGGLNGSASANHIDIDLDSASAVKIASSFLPGTNAKYGRQSKPASHWGYRLAEPGAETEQFKHPITGAMLVEFRSDGSQSIRPGSLHEASNELYRWDEDGSPAVVDEDKLRLACATVAAASVLIDYWTKGNRNELCCALAGSLLRLGAPEEMIQNFVAVIASATGDDEPKVRKVSIRNLAKSMSTGKGRVPGWKKLAECTDPKVVEQLQQWFGGAAEDISDDDLALRFVDKHADALRYVPAWGKWLLWDGCRFAADELLSVIDMARAELRRVRDEMSGSLTKPRRSALRARLGSATTIYSTIKLGSGDSRVAVKVEQLDADPWALNTPAGVVDLRTGAVKPHNPAELHTKITGAAPGGECPIFHRVLDRAIPDKETQAYLQRVFGYGLTGSSRDHALVFIYGNGRNGKGTIVYAMLKAMGDYGVNIPAETLLESHSDRHPTELASFRAARLVVGSEVNPNRHWNEARLKSLTGGDRISARLMGKDFFEFDPTHTLIIAGNSKPGLRVIDEAIKRRIQLVHFDQTIPVEELDTTLPEKLATEYGGILQWAIEGCLEWQRQGLNAPAAVQASSHDYLSAEDHIEQWINESCNRSGEVSLARAFSSYKYWCTDNSAAQLGRNTFADQLASHDGVQRTRPGVKVVAFRGLSLKAIRDREINA